MGSKFKLSYVLVRNKMSSELPPLGPFKEISRLIAWWNYLWACYQTLLGNYHALSAENTRLQKIVVKATQRAAAAEHCAAAAEQCAAAAEQRAAAAEQCAAAAEQRAAAAEQCAAAAEQRTAQLQKIAAEAIQSAATAKQHAAVAEKCADQAADDAQYWKDLALEAERKLDVLHQQEAAETEILHELCYDASWTSVSKGTFVGKQTKAVLKANAEVLGLKSKLRKSIENCKRLADSISDLFHCPIDLGVPESSPVLCVGVRNGPAFVSSAETAKKLNGKHPLLQGEAFVPITLSGLEDTIKELFYTNSQNELLAKFLQL